MLAVLIGLSIAVQPAGQWQDFGSGADGVAVAVNLDSIERNDLGTEAMVRLRNARSVAGQAAQSDNLMRFDCGGRTATRLRMVQLDAAGAVVDRPETGETMAPVRIVAGTPMNEVLTLVCSIAV